MNGSFSFSASTLRPEDYRTALADPAAGGYASFEGWVRDHNEGQRVLRLEYEAFEALAIKEGQRIVGEAIRRFGIRRAACVHRVGDLAIGDLAVWVGASADHRAEAFAACRYIIDEVKHRVPIWKKEHYVDGNSGWVNCERCAQPGEHEHLHAHAGEHHHADAPRAAPDYSRQVALPEVGPEGQARIGSARVVVIGAGGLGVPVLQYLAAAGVGELVIVDGDVVEASNLHRQPLYESGDVGKPKAAVAADRLRRLNPAIRVEAVAEHAGASNIDALVTRADVIVECTDNFRSKFLVNDAVVRAAKPAVFASVYQYEGQLQVYRPLPEAPCLRCLWPDAPKDGLIGNCAEAGVLGPVPGTLGALQAMETLKLILGLGDATPDSLVVLDLLTLTSRRMRTQRNPDCAHDGGRPAAVEKDALELSFTSLQAARAAGFELIDIREAWEREYDPPPLRIERHVALSEWLNGTVGLEPGPRYLIVCAHGVRSLGLTERLRELGFPSVYSLRGGLAELGLGD